MVRFKKIESKNNMVELANYNLSKFMTPKEINELDGYILVNGPGSFTGSKVALNIIKAIDLKLKINKAMVTNSLKLLSDSKTKYTAIPFGKTKFLFKKNKGIGSSKFKIITKEKLAKFPTEKVLIGYDKLNISSLETKFKDRTTFKMIALDKVEILYSKSII
ncbi:MAG: hypothetical protein DRP42_06025 [Tenericutes bacterium]|nr:MAG: hypothetical protein DRP42_06025 [Mycoplasmatota bacterium]